MSSDGTEEAAQSIIKAYMTAAENVGCKDSLKAMCDGENGIEKSALKEQMDKMGNGPFTLKDHIIAYLSAYDAKKAEAPASSSSVEVDASEQQQQEQEEQEETSGKGKGMEGGRRRRKRSKTRRRSNKKGKRRLKKKKSRRRRRRR